ncbi:male sterility protein-domain-containing protein [Bisporella sp. PMI_857]|nr:male sterility protein-domain-containing protein [Bisporella sp. PMI_857]
MMIKSNTVLVTGATGFLGKVFVEELLRQQSDYSIPKIILLICIKDLEAHQRFKKHIAASPCFARLPTDWTKHIQVINGDFADQNCGIPDADYEEICQRITNIVHIAGCIKFDSEVSEALSSNVDGALNILTIARNCKKLQQLVITSTAYVMPPQMSPIRETLVRLPQPATQIYNDMKSGNLSMQQAFELTRHPNIYSLSKCLAENLISERQGSLPITIVRPSIICAAWKYPIPGWVDSKADFAGLVLSFGMGILKVVNGRRDTKLDIVPVDKVASHLIQQTFRECPSNIQSFQLRIIFSVATAQHSLALGDACEMLQAFFDWRSTISSRLNFRHVGAHDLLFNIYELFDHKMRLHLRAIICRVQGKKKEAAEAKKSIPTKWLKRSKSRSSAKSADTSRKSEQNPELMKAKAGSGEARRLQQNDAILAGPQNVTDQPRAGGPAEPNTADKPIGLCLHRDDTQQVVPQSDDLAENAEARADPRVPGNPEEVADAPAPLQAQEHNLWEQAYKAVEESKDFEGYVMKYEKDSSKEALPQLPDRQKQMLVTHPTTKKKDAIKLLDMITDRMNRYHVIEEMFRSPAGSKEDSAKVVELRAKFETKTVALYTEILKAQILLACTYARSSFLQYGRDVIKWDDWASMRGKIVKKEDDINADISVLDQARIFRMHAMLKQIATERNKIVEMFNKQAQLD